MLIEASEHTLEGKIDAEFNRIRFLKYKSGANCVKNNEKSLYNRLSVWKLLCPLQENLHSCIEENSNRYLK